MANVRKKISELTALTSASLDTTLLGIDSGTTYKIELDTLADAVTSRVNILDRDRLFSLESVTSSFETKGRSVISSSAQITTLGFISSSTTIPTGTISSSAQITSFGFVSSSIDISSLNSFTSSQSSLNTAFANGINARLQTSSFDTFSQSVDSRLIAATNEQSFNGLISGSSQFTASFDQRYVVSGSVTQTTWTNISGKPDGIISGSSQISDFGFVTSSVVTGTPLDYVYLKYSSSVDIPNSGSYLKPDGNSFGNISYNNSNGYFNLNGNSTYILEANTKLASSGNELALVWYDITNNRNVPAGNEFWNDTEDQQIVKAIITTSASTQVALKVSYKSGNSTIDYGRSYIFVQKSTLGSGSIGVSSYNDLTDIPVGIVSQSTDLSSLNTFTASISTASLVNRLNVIENVSGSWITESETGSFLTSLSGAISSSSQLTSSYDTRYVISGSVGATPSGTISGSSQLTSSFDTRYAASGSVSSNINTASLATTGSNSFNGNQTITGSLVVGSVAVVNGGINVPTGSIISLTSGSSLFVDASGSITGSLTGSVFGIGDVVAFSSSVNSRIISGSVVAGTISGSSQLTSSFDTRYALSASFVSSSNVVSMQTITSASYAALTPVSGTLYIIIG